MAKSRRNSSPPTRILPLMPLRFCRAGAIDKGATKLMKPGQTAKEQAAAKAAYQTKLVPPPDPMEAILLATFPVDESDLETLAASRAKAVRAYLLQSGKVEAARLFLMENQATGLRNDGSRVYLQFR